MNTECKVLRKRAVMVALVTWIAFLNTEGLCWANPIVLPVKIGTPIQFATYLTGCLAVMIVPAGLYLLLWRLVTFSAVRKNNIKKHGAVFGYIGLGLLLGPYWIGLCILAFGLVKAAKLFFEDVHPEEGKRTGVRTAVCVWCYNVLLILLWNPVAHSVARFWREVVDYKSYFRYTTEPAVYEVTRMMLSFTHWYPARDLYIFFALCAIWIVTLLVYWKRQGGSQLKKHIPDIIAVFGLLFTGYWFWFYGGILIYVMAMVLGMASLSGLPGSHSALSSQGNPVDMNVVKQEVEKMEVTEIIKELEEQGETVDRSLPYRKLQKQLIHNRLNRPEKQTNQDRG